MALKRCISAFAATIKNRPHVVKVGDLVDDGDALYQGRERFFEDVSPTAGGSPKVEQATAAPGEKRRAGRPSKSRESTSTSESEESSDA